MDSSITEYLTRAKHISDALAAASRPLSLVDFNMYALKGLRPEFNDITTTLQAWVEPVTFDAFQSLLLTREYTHKSQAVSPNPYGLFFLLQIVNSF